MNEDSIAFVVKRRRLNSGGSQSTNTYNYNFEELGAKKYKSHLLITDLPVDILIGIFNKMPYRFSSTTVRLVCKTFNEIMTTVLNFEFQRVGNAVDKVVKQTDRLIESAENNYNKYMLARDMNFLDIVKSQYTSLHSSVWRHLNIILSNGNPGCFYAGLILDLFRKAIRVLRRRPASTKRKITILNNLKQFTKMFITYFEKTNEKPFIKQSPFITGCKFLDILDCFIEGNRTVENETLEDGMYSAKIKYKLDSTWITSLTVPPKKADLSEEVRLMQLRLHRLVFAHNMLSLQRRHLHTEHRLFPEPSHNVSEQESFKYSGYGEYGGRFFYYGVINTAALSVFDNLVLDDINEEDLEINNVQQETMTDQQLIVYINVNIRCPIIMSPYCVFNSFYTDFDAFCDLLNKDCVKVKNNFKLSIEFYSTTAKDQRLPYNFKYVLEAVDGYVKSFFLDVETKADEFEIQNENSLT